MTDDTIEVQSCTTGQFWLVRKFDKKEYLPVVLYHRHSDHMGYHVHFVYGDDNALLAYLEIWQHDKYIKQREAKRKSITALSNMQLVAALSQRE